MGRFVLVTFCPLGRFVPWNVLSLGTFCPWDLMSWDDFVLGRFLPWDFLSMGCFVCAPNFRPFSFIGLNCFHIELAIASSVTYTANSAKLFYISNFQIKGDDPGTNMRVLINLPNDDFCLFLYIIQRLLKANAFFRNLCVLA